MRSIERCSDECLRLKRELDTADAVVVGAGAGLSAAAGLCYDGPRFRAHFGDFEAAYGFHDMYSGGFYPYETPETFWAYWSRSILLNRYTDPPKDTYRLLRKLVGEKDYFILTTNVDHCFQRSGFDKARLFYTQGDYGLFQCSVPCRQETYDNERAVRRMAAEQRDLRVPTELLPYCPRCGKPMTVNLRTDSRFVEDSGWHAAAERYGAFLRRHSSGHVLYLELGVGYNTPSIIKYPFWRMTARNPDAVLACVNLGQTDVPRELNGRAFKIDGDIHTVLSALI